MSKQYAPAGKEYDMENKEKYIRVGTTLYKIVRRPLISGDYIEEKILWSYEALRQDYGKNNLPEIEKYDGFCIIPSHINYQQIYGTFLNQYEPIRYSGDMHPVIPAICTHLLNYHFDKVIFFFLNSHLLTRFCVMYRSFDPGRHQPRFLR